MQQLHPGWGPVVPYPPYKGTKATRCCHVDPNHVSAPRRRHSAAFSSAGTNRAASRRQEWGSKGPFVAALSREGAGCCLLPHPYRPVQMGMVSSIAPQQGAPSLQPMAHVQQCAERALLCHPQCHLMGAPVKCSLEGGAALVAAPQPQPRHSPCSTEACPAAVVHGEPAHFAHNSNGWKWEESPWCGAALQALKLEKEGSPVQLSPIQPRSQQCCAAPHKVGLIQGQPSLLSRSAQ